jgi:hypothetical protein
MIQALLSSGHPKINLQAYTPFFGAYGKQGMIVSLTNNV